jgi:hypothetical protein
MDVKVFGAGVGRTGTLTLRTALDLLGFGPCHHMKVVLENPPHHVPLWNAVVDGRAEWSAVYAGQNSAVDWPTASFYRELHAVFPKAKFILTHRDPATWVASFRETIYTAIGNPDQAPPEAKPWFDMCTAVIARAGFPLGLDDSQLAERFAAHNDAVRAAIPASQLLEFQVKEGWEPLCDFLDVAVPAQAFPRTNDRAQFWELVNDGTENLAN